MFAVSTYLSLRAVKARMEERIDGVSKAPRDVWRSQEEDEERDK